MKWPLAFGLAVLAAQAHVSAATMSGCEGSYVLQGKHLELVEGWIAASTIAFQGEVTAVDRDPAAQTQKITLRVLNPWKGQYRVGDDVSLTVPVYDACAGKGCVFPFKIGDVTLLLSPSSTPSFFEWCWIHEGVVLKSVLSVPAVPMPHS
jgi:hypothetical protein